MPYSARMDRSKALLIAGQLVCLGIAGWCLWVAYGPPSVDEMRRSRFYADGAAIATVINSESLKGTREYHTCEEGFEHTYKNPRAPEWSKPRDSWDKASFLLGCSEASKVR